VQKKIAAILRIEWVLAASLLLAVAQPAQAHPHVFIETRMDVQFDADGFLGIQVEWVFDAMFGNRIIADYDRDKNGRFDDGEIAQIEKKAFSNLSKFNYFTYIYIGNRRHDVRQVSDFKASISRKTVSYTFFVPYEQPWDQLDGNIFIGFFDKTNFCDFQFPADRPFSVSAPPDFAIYTKIVATRDGWVRNRAFEELSLQYKKR
jgi:ABC-type uncharacterized transport system substrate-binding protein